MLGAVFDVGRFNRPQDGLSVRTVVLSLLALHLLALFTIGAAPYLPAIVTTPVIVLALTFVPGSLVLFSLADRARIDARWMVYAVGLSLLSVMFVGFVVNMVLPLVGVAAPLSVQPLAVSMTVYVALVSVPPLYSGSQQHIEIAIPPLFRPVPLALALLPLVSILSVTYLNRTSDNLPILVTLAVIALIPLAALRLIPREYHAFGIWTVALAVLYHKSLWAFSGFAGSPGVVRAWEAGRWTAGFDFVQPTSTELLQNGVLFPAYAKLAQIHIFTQLEVVNPLLVSFIPVALFITFRRYIGSKAALVGAALFVFAHPFYMQYPTAGRAATPVLFLAMFGVVVSDLDLRRSVAAGLGMLFLVGVVVSHYGTSYFVAAALLGAVGVAWLLRVARDRVGLPSTFDTEDGRYTNSLLTTGLAGFFLVTTVSWYLYLTGGRKFEILPRHSAHIVEQFLSGTLFAGRTTARIQRDYGTPTVQLSKYVYFAIGLLIALGLAVAAYRYLSEDHESNVDVQYLSLAMAAFALFGLTILFRTWGGGRPMMITLVFTAMFAVIGAVWIGRTVSQFAPIDRQSLRAAGLGAFAVLIAVLLLLNTGVLSSVALGGTAPSNVPLQAQFEESSDPSLRSNVYQETDVGAHVWFVQHLTATTVYGDSIAHGQTDWKLPQIEAQTPGLSSYGPIRPRNRVGELVNPGVESGYVILLGHNQALDIMWDGDDRAQVPIAQIDAELLQRHRVYSNDHSVIYYAAEE